MKRNITLYLLLATFASSFVGCSSAPKYYITNSTVEPEPTIIYQNVCPPPVIYPQPVITFEPMW